MVLKIRLDRSLWLVWSPASPHSDLVRWVELSKGWIDIRSSELTIKSMNRTNRLVLSESNGSTHLFLSSSKRLRFYAFSINHLSPHSSCSTATSIGIVAIGVVPPDSPTAADWNPCFWWLVAEFNSLSL